MIRTANQETRLPTWDGYTSVDRSARAYEPRFHVTARFRSIAGKGMRGRHDCIGAGERLVHRKADVRSTTISRKT